ncbi:wall-associated receptor kinase 2-like isoform X1 [Macadamia integrifolia]|uniref:wall-associated receptor kinase 2-like isoform X1 n=1 Tax=Macadamia integrifolia TaxID=60698 RepID=UPI001C4E8B08|nr:wall-associated receptor kinase 2-like isoform X1 [Macadamia integrifolia]
MEKIVLMNLLILLPSFLSLVSISMAVPPLALPGCQEKCGNMNIPYPFGIGEGCFKSLGYQILCKPQDDTFKPYRERKNLRGNQDDDEVLEISLLEAQIKVKNRNYASQCFNSTGEESDSKNYTSDDAWIGSPFTFSSSRNKIIAIGCDTLAFISDVLGIIFTSGCLAACDRLNMITAADGSCSGLGCCQGPIPLGLKSFLVTLDSFNNHTRVCQYNPCSFAFLAEQDWFIFNSSSDLSSSTLNRTYIPVVLDWAIGDPTSEHPTCEQARNDTKSYACGPNSYCSDSINGPGYGYRCNCSDGFEGNPYLLQVGCQDINECENGYNNLCDKSGKCKNTIGSYSCYCPQGYHGDGWTNGTRCTQDKQNSLIKIIAGAGVGTILVFICIYLSYLGIQRRRMIKRREKFFQQNGGLLLQQQIASRRGVTDISGIFTIEQLKKATNNFDDSRILGQGGFGTVYKGILSNGKVVAIKKSKIMDKGQIIQFINEVDILSQINHRNVVKLLGCCLETEVPLLVYEFISNGTLSQHIHNEHQSLSISWGNRLRIAAETAGALGYLHSSHSIPILHRDVKSTNILLDDNYIAKVSDFGASRLAPLNQTQATTLVQGTLGYLDPECFYTGQLIDKSDVYTFGVVLVELLTRQKAILSEGIEDCKSLAMHFVSSMKDNNLFQILDYQVVNEGDREQLVAVAELARRCLKVKGEDRPTKKEVAMELDSLIKLYENPWIQHKYEETESLLGGASTSSTINGTDQESFGYSIMQALEITR